MVMDVYSLAERLRDADPRIRVAALRILAMVEETRALAAIQWIYQNDPEPGVRAVAQWAGNLIWQAQQRGHSTQRAIEEIFTHTLSPEHEARFLNALQFDPNQVRSFAGRRFAYEQEYQRRIEEVFQEEALPASTEETPPALPPPAATQPDLDPDDLLDAGLTDLLTE